MKTFAMLALLLTFTFSGCMGIHQLSPAPVGSNVDHAKSPSGKDLTKENDPPAR